MSKKEREDGLDEKALRKCMEVMKGINDLGDEEDHFRIKMKKILEAFNALKEVFAGTDIYYLERQIVASAIISDDKYFPYHPYSKVGDTICALIQVCLLMNTKSELECLLDQEQFGIQYVDDIIELLDKCK
jgi:hypothetical protein